MDTAMALLATLTLLVGLVVDLGADTSWQSEWTPNSRQTSPPVWKRPTSQVFEGMESEEDGFKLLLQEDDKAFIGAKNRVYYMSLHDSRNISTLVWEADAKSQKTCRRKGKEKCSNYIRVVVRRSDKELYVCGTNAYAPVCRIYDMQANGQFKKRDEEEEGFGVCPFDPDHNSTSVFADNIIFSGTDADENNRHPIILRKSGDARPVATQGKDSMFLNEPQFVSSFEKDDKVFFFFRENAVENINCGKSMFSRVAQVCKSDKSQDQFTSFFKARLNCSIPGDFPFYFDEIQATSIFGQGNFQPTRDSGDRHDLIYGVFSTPENSVHGSAVCAFKYSDIVKVFQNRFKGQEHINSNWLPISLDKTPRPHPTECQSGTPSHERLKFSRNHALMDEAVPAQGQMPILVHTSFKSRFTSIAIDWQRRAADGKYYDILFVGTDDGRVIKAVNKGQGHVEPVVIEDTQVLEPGEAVVNLKVLSHRTDSARQKLVVISKQRVVSLPLHRCALATSCQRCVALQDPYCVWESDLRKCLSAEEGIQNITTGTHRLCNNDQEIAPIAESKLKTPSSECDCPKPQTGGQNQVNYGNDGLDPNTQGNGFPNYGITDPDTANSKSTISEAGLQMEILIVAVIIATIVSLIIGFLIGYKFQSCRFARDSDDVFIQTKTATLQRGRNRLSSGDNHYLQNEPLTPKQMNYVVNLKSSRGSASDVKPVTKSNKVWL